MKTVNIYEAKTQLSKLVEGGVQGRAPSFIASKAGKPIVKVTALTAPTGDKVKRLGFMAGQITVPGRLRISFKWAARRSRSSSGGRE